jgi:hypothetical protein
MMAILKWRNGERREPNRPSSSKNELDKKDINMGYSVIEVA